MPNFLDSDGVKYLWSQLSLQDYPNNETLVSVINAIDEIKVNKTDLIDLVYPIGAIYISVNNTSPSTLFGGSWEQIKDTFLLSAGDSYTAGTTGGEAVHTLSTDEMPSHTHTASSKSAGAHTHTIGCDTDAAKGTYCSSVHGSSTGAESFKGATNSAGAHTHTITVNSTGGSQAHNNMPPYLTVYMWKRTA